MNNQPNNYQAWPQIIMLAITLTISISYLLLTFTWQWHTNWPPFDQHLPHLLSALKGLFFKSSGDWSRYYELIEASNYEVALTLHLLIPIVFSTIISIYLSVKLFYVPEGRSSVTHLQGPILLHEKSALHHAKKMHKKEMKNDRVGSGINLHPKISISKQRELGNIFVYGQQGSGKSVIIKPIIKEIIDRDDRILIYDEKREYTALFFDDNATLISATDKRGTAWNICADVRNEESALLIATCLIPDSEDDFWSKGARLIFAGCILFLKKTRVQWGWQDLKQTLDLPQSDLKKILSKYYPSASKLLEEESKTSQGFLTILITQLSWIEALAKAWPDSTTNGFSITEWVSSNSKKVIIIPSDPLYSSISGPLCNALMGLITQHVLALPDSNNRRIWFALDELGNLPKCESLEKWLSLGRSKGTRTIAGTQSISQIHSVYGQQPSETLLNLFNHIICLRLGSSGDTSKKACASFGLQTVERPIVTLDKNGNSSTTYQHLEEPVVKPEQIIHLPQASKKGVHGFISINGWNAVYKLIWPIPNIIKCCEEYVPADWLSTTSISNKRGRRGRKQ